MQPDTSQEEKKEEIKPIEELPLDQRVKIASTYDILERIHPGCLVDALDKVNKWCVARVLDFSNNSFRVNFDGWSARYDETYSVNERKISPFRYHSRGYTGQIRVPLRAYSFTLELLHNHQNHVNEILASNFNCFSDPFEITQYLRGYLYIFVDMAMTTEHNPGDLPFVYNFLHSIAKLIALWLKLFPSQFLVPFIESKNHFYLYCIDKNVALALSAYEIIDMLNWLLCGCTRTGLFFAKYDVDIVGSERHYTKDFVSRSAVQNLQFVSYDTFDSIRKENQKIFGLVVNLFETFCANGGFDAITKILSVEEIMIHARNKGYPNYILPTHFLELIIHPLKNVKNIVKREYCIEKIVEVKRSYEDWINNLDEQNIREMQVNVIVGNFSSLTELFCLVYSKEEVVKTTQTYHLIIALRLLESKAIEKRLNGLKEIGEVITKAVTFDSANAQSLPSVPAASDSPDAEGQRVSAKENVKRWIIRNGIIKKIYNENTHAELIKNSCTIFMLLGTLKAITKEMVEALWILEQESTAEISVEIDKVITYIIRYLGTKDIMYIYNKINDSIVEYNDGTKWGFLKDFTKNGLMMYYKEQPQKIYEFTEEEDQAFKSLLNEPVVLPSGKELYFTNLFWNLANDDSFFDYDLRIETIAYLSDIMSCIENKYYLFQYLHCFMDNAKNNILVLESLTLTIAILKVINEESKRLCSYWIKLLDDKYDLIEVFMNSCQLYKDLVCTKVKNDKDLTYAFLDGKYIHRQSLLMRFNFLGELMGLGVEKLIVGKENVDKLWKMYTDDNILKFDTREFLKWIPSQMKLESLSTIFNREESLYLFEKICDSYEKLLNTFELSYYLCFEHNFIIINSSFGKVSYISDRILVKDSSEIIGLECIWNCVYHSNVEVCHKKFNDLLLDIYTNFDRTVSPEERKRLKNTFIDRCFEKLNEDNPLTITNVLKLLADFLKWTDKEDYKIQPKAEVTHEIKLIENDSIVFANE